MKRKYISATARLGPVANGELHSATVALQRGPDGHAAVSTANDAPGRA